jgi:O-antigen/teichoic acid export membrane protein
MPLMAGAGASIFARLESNSRLLAMAKLVNVGLAMLWGFVVTFVFVRLLPLHEFRAFLLLVAFANFTISADFGFSGIIYARLRPFWLARGGKDAAASGRAFDPSEIALLFAFMLAVIVAGGLAVGIGLATGFIPTGRPGLFMAFYALSALNILAILAKRALAALDYNLFWEALDAGRRTLSLALLLVALAGVPILLSVVLQIGLTTAALIAGFATVHSCIGMRLHHWLQGPREAGRIGRDYVHDMGRTMALTISDVAAYNAPYLCITLATRDPRPLLVFDFLFKMSRALTAGIRALVESGLPRLTEAWHAGRHAEVRARIDRLRLMGLASAAALGLFLLVAGPLISRVIFDGHAVLGRDELACIALLLCGLSSLCVSTFVHNALGKFAALLLPSFLFLTGSILAVPLAWFVAGETGVSFALAFVAVYALVHVLIAVRHERMLQELSRA